MLVPENQNKKIMSKPSENTYPWTFTSVGGAVRVKIKSGEDIRHLGELDRKMWTVLSCPVRNLEFDAKALQYIDVDNDGNIRVDEVIATAQWLTSILKNADVLLQGRAATPWPWTNSTPRTPWEPASRHRPARF